MFNFVVLYEVVLIFVIRNDYQVPFWANKWVWAAAVLSVVLQGLLMYTPLSKIFKIIPLGLTDINLLLASGGLFLLVAMLYQSLARKYSAASNSGLKVP